MLLLRLVNDQALFSCFYTLKKKSNWKTIFIGSGQKKRGLIDKMPSDIMGRGLIAETYPRYAGSIKLFGKFQRMDRGFTY